MGVPITKEEGEEEEKEKEEGGGRRGGVAGWSVDTEPFHKRFVSEHDSGR